MFTRVISLSIVHLFNQSLYTASYISSIMKYQVLGLQIELLLDLVKLFNSLTIITIKLCVISSLLLNKSLKNFMFSEGTIDLIVLIIQLQQKLQLMKLVKTRVYIQNYSSKNILYKVIQLVFIKIRVVIALVNIFQYSGLDIDSKKTLI